MAKPKKNKSITPEVVPSKPQAPKKISLRNTFVKDLKKVEKYPEYKKNAKKLEQYLNMIANGEALPRIADDHKLAKHSPGELAYCREFHLETDIVVIYRNDGDVVDVIHIGKHSHTRLTSSLEL